MTMVLFALVFVLLITFLGLVIDGGFLLASHRQAQNAADAAALAAAFDLMRGRTMEDARATAHLFATDNLPDGAVFTLDPPPDHPRHGPYKEGESRSRYVEVFVVYNVPTFLMHAVGMAPENPVVARAVAGYEATSAGEGVMVLDRNARPGLGVDGANANIRVVGRIVVNSQGGGVDENGQPVEGTLRAAEGGAHAGVFAELIDVVGGVNDPTKFRHISQFPGFEDREWNGISPLRCRATPESDPLIELPTPTIQNGVDPTDHGAVKVTNQNESLKAPNFVWKEEYEMNRSVYGKWLDRHEPKDGHVILHPGVYSSIDITGGTVYLIPGIYVISPKGNDPSPIQITGGDVRAEGVMFYNTASSYSPTDGSPDNNDGENESRVGRNATGEDVGGISINAGMRFTPIDTRNINYRSMYPGANQIVEPRLFDGMLFYQRRRNHSPFSISGNADSEQLLGTIYAKWAPMNITGQGTYNAQFIVGSIKVSGQGRVTVEGAGDNRGRANAVFLVE